MVNSSRIHSIDAGKTPERLCAERAKRLMDAMELKQPDRIPISLMLSYMLAEIGGITKQELLENPDKAQELLEKAAIEYQPDSISGPLQTDPRPSLILGDRMTRWPGHGMSPNAEFQFVENDYMKAEDYDEFLEDPDDWGVRVYLPRICEALAGFSMLPQLRTSLFGSVGISNFSVFALPQMETAIKAIENAAMLINENIARAARNAQRMAAIGFPQNPLFGSFMTAPFDVMSDTLRGMRGVMLDIMERPEKLLAAEEIVSRFQIKTAVNLRQNFGIKGAMIPLHRGSDGFMSIAHFERFYWPQLKRMIIQLVENDITPLVFYEGVWDQRLKYLAELPKAKTVGMFQASDIFKVKEVLGDTMCIIGGMPNSLLCNGPINEVRDFTRKLCQIVGKGGGYVMSVGVGEMSGSKPELVKAWVDATHEYGVY